MKTKEIRDLIDFISQSGLNEVKIETEELKLSIKRDPDVKTQVVESSVVSASAPAAPAPSAAPAPAAASAPAPASAPASSEGNYVEVKSPMIGTFYRSSNPDSPAFVNVGDKVEKGQTLCIVEAMKLFNEIESDVSGTIVKVVAENASPVEYDQVLFLVDPS
ncbi:acetyl-CoA carboxylase biotin carboxyl carrier protein [Fulvivirga lutea]|uniref:Biotin carboxyl carrier protein of acetyl-CoA carboxylase n=1 Tax=Fulvivirga lutea TaxID=2810512 RepID=A0A974WH32_9BACT|nr:acetyl-CoA carboxylase biotin carboxyl carrier protein [Fulvivirga lutea]QSE96992.1 acetyl-CoA carboxylase biotin carboxyl carrier protein [Fulvivirga lutea]